MKSAHSDIRLFMRLEPDISKLTHQNGIKTRGVNGHAQVYKTPAMCSLEAKYVSLLRKFAPKEPWDCPICLTTEWIFRKPKPAKGILQTTNPDPEGLHDKMRILEGRRTRLLRELRQAVG